MGLKKTLNDIAGWFQPAYNKIDKWDLPWLRTLCGELWELLDENLKKALYNLITGLADKYGEKKARAIMETLKKELDTVVK